MKLIVDDEIVITEILKSDLPFYLKHLNNPSVTTFVNQIPHPYTESDFKGWLEFIAEEKEKYGKVTHFAIRKNGELIGGVGLTGMEGHVATTGSWLCVEEQGKGIGTKVKQIFNAFLIKEFGLKRLEAYVFSGNTASEKCLEKCGFVLEGRLKKYYFHRGQFYDKLIFGFVVD